MGENFRAIASIIAWRPIIGSQYGIPTIPTLRFHIMSLLGHNLLPLHCSSFVCKQVTITILSHVKLEVAVESDGKDLSCNAMIRVLVL